MSKTIAQQLAERGVVKPREAERADRIREARQRDDERYARWAEAVSRKARRAR